MAGLRIHPKYGVNPTLGVCFWCGEGDGTIGLLGLNGGKEAPHNAILSLDPCEKCKANMLLGIAVIEATAYQRDPWQVELRMGAFPTGRWCVVKRDAKFWEAVKEPMRTLAMQRGKIFMLPELYEGFGFVGVGEKEVQGEKDAGEQGADGVGTGSGAGAG